MAEIRQTAIFADRLLALSDKRSRARIAARIERLRDGNFGDVKPIGEGVAELRLHYGPGFRIYFTARGDQIIILLCGGDKSSQDKDIARAKTLVAQLEDSQSWH
jgi:putative addiction module killer protein